MTTLTINLDEQIKSQAQQKVKKEGLTLTALISRFLKEYLQGKWEMRIMSPQAEARMLAAIKESDEEIASGKAKLYNNVDKMMDDILNEPAE
jgi:antitoxin component of RelBE/YafQ-DinJ toxin-antitoxin module